MKLLYLISLIIEFMSETFGASLFEDFFINGIFFIEYTLQISKLLVFSHM